MNRGYQKKKCARCLKVFETPGIHCLCVQHDPSKGWIWCSAMCRTGSHRKKQEKGDKHNDYSDHS